MKQLFYMVHGNKKKVVNTLLVLVLLILPVIYFFTNTFVPERESGNHVIVLKESGYEPSFLQIEVGETVTFVTDRNLKHWPASNNHPIHEGLPKFDPGRSLEFDESWSFIFTESGSWGFHDHLYSHFTGTILVE